jgi:hypothetical protein
MAGVPVLGKEDVVELLGDVVDAWEDGVSVRDGQGAAGKEVVLHVDDEERVGRLEGEGHGLIVVAAAKGRSPAGRVDRKARARCRFPRGDDYQKSSSRSRQDDNQK